VKRNDRGTPQGGVLSPLLANVYLHWFDHVFHRTDGPTQWAKAKLIRYADDFVVLARHVTPRLRNWIEGKLEGWLDLQINREKTRVLDLRQSGQSLDFLGYTFRQDRDQYGRPQRYWNLVPSRKALHGSGHAAWLHQSAPKPHAAAGVDRADESASAGLGQLLWLGLPAGDVSPPEPLRAVSAGDASAPTQSTRLARS